MSRRKELKINLIVEPSKHKYTKEDLHKTLKSSISIILDDLIINEHIKVGN